MNRGDVYLCGLGESIGHEQGYRRPVLIVSHDEITRLGIPFVLPITKTKTGYATHVEIDGVRSSASYIRCEQVRMADTERFVSRIAAVDGMTVLKVELILKRLLGLH